MISINTDSNPSDDLLGRKKFAEEIAAGLIMSYKKGEESFVFGLNGRWGSGKTTLMNYLKDSLVEKLGDTSDYIIFDFNPWMFSGRDELLSIFLKDLSRVTSPRNTALKDIVSGLGDAVSYFEWVKYVNATAAEWQKSLKDQLTTWSSAPNIRELKDKIDQAIVDKELRLYVFIDDLDRLTPQEVIEVFQIIKLNANFKNTVFIISFDKEVVQQILTTHYGFHGEKYLEKIIQVDYRIPDLLDETIEAIFFENLQRFSDQFELTLVMDDVRAIWTIHCLKYYFNTLRDIHRYFNALKLRLPAIKNDVNIYQFLVVEALRVFDFATYEAIQRNYKKGVQFGPKTQSKDIDNLIIDENSKVLYNYLFESRPLADGVYSIAEPQYFDRYFALAIGKFDVEEKLVLQFLKDKSARSYIIGKAIEGNRIRSLLTRLRSIQVDLDSLQAIIQWPAESEQIFLECRAEFIDAVAHVIESNGDFANGMSFLVSILHGNDRHFNPAKFYLIHYFLCMEQKNMDKIFSKHYDMIKSNEANFKKIELDVLKQYESDHLIFARPSFKTDFFHKVFLKEYAKAHPDEYKNKLKAYFAQSDRALQFASFLFRDEAGKTIADPYWVKALLSTEIFAELDARIGEVKTLVLSSSNKRSHELYSTLKDDIKAGLNGSNDELS